MQNVLKKAARVQTHDFIRISQELEQKSVHPGVCRGLRDYAMETYLSNKKEE